MQSNTFHILVLYWRGYIIMLKILEISISSEILHRFPILVSFKCVIFHWLKIELKNIWIHSLYFHLQWSYNDGSNGFTFPRCFKVNMKVLQDHKGNQQQCDCLIHTIVCALLPFLLFCCFYRLLWGLKMKKPDKRKLLIASKLLTLNEANMYLV